ncbi:hypothetical protein KVV02_007561 [Mortierella alpina]|uniref:Uncharacterized protein n=1 Tax=Mortierella alpina TaxID=64518 RepID=A0A9P7ZWC7_MORAP|nr:hypothetical protein KVV02_007561 [Mortierella alpina]
MRMKISLTVATIAAVALASSAEAIRVCRSVLQDDNTCAYECKNGDPADGKWCSSLQKRLISDGADCWGDCNSGNGYQFWCNKSSISPTPNSVCGRYV